MEGGNASRLGRRRIQIFDDLKNGKIYWELKEEVENQEEWRTRFRVHRYAPTLMNWNRKNQLLRLPSKAYEHQLVGINKG